MWTDEEPAAGEQTASAREALFPAAREAVLLRAEATEETAHVADVKNRHESALPGRENVGRVATSLKVTGGRPTQHQSLTVVLERKLPLEQVPEESRVPEQLDGVPTDVVESGRFVAATFTGRVRSGDTRVQPRASQHHRRHVRLSGTRHPALLLQVGEGLWLQRHQAGTLWQLSDPEQQSHPGGQQPGTARRADSPVRPGRRWALASCDAYAAIECLVVGIAFRAFSEGSWGALC